MTDYISREDAIEVLNEVARKNFTFAYEYDRVLNILMDCDKTIRQLPAADVFPNVRGRWLHENNPAYSPFDGTAPFLDICNQCGYTRREKGRIWQFCPVCGADMQGEE